ncbi:MAG: YigZ family protein [Synergistaceae bacterium]|jgi:putative IMPACT (imprinted ancient) family translation regulator|nr:YigZ family protein [Synergistaceae bacterium]
MGEIKITPPDDFFEPRAEGAVAPEWSTDPDPVFRMTVKRSIFEARVFLCRSAGDARDILSKVGTKYRGATHHCWAYVLASPSWSEAAERCSDAGEPSGTAGRPILSALKGRNPESRGPNHDQTASGEDSFPLLNAMVVVSRWFGGVKLGPRGLINAYGQAAASALANTPLVPAVRTRRFVLCYPYSAAGEVARILKHPSVVGKPVIIYDSGSQSPSGGQCPVTAEVNVRASQAAEFEGFVSSSSGSINSSGEVIVL